VKQPRCCHRLRADASLLLLLLLPPALCSIHLYTFMGQCSQLKPTG
jgi:hypothetical protein